MSRVNSDAKPIDLVKILQQLRCSTHSGINKAIKVSVSTLKKESRLYLKSVYAIKEDGTEELEKIADFKPHIKMINGKAWFSLQRSRGGQAKVPIDRLKDNNSNAIFRVLSMIKRLTCKEDKLYLEVVDNILRERLLEESVNDTSIVQGFPQRITVFMFSKKASLEFDGIKSINSIAYLSEMLKKLEEPPPVNALEVEARDFVKDRLDLVSEELRQLRAEESKKKKEALKQLQGRKP